MAKIYYKDRAYYSIEEKVDVDDVVSEIKYNWYYDEGKHIVIRETIADGSFKIWLQDIVIDDNSTGAFRYLVPSNLRTYALAKNGVAAAAQLETQVGNAGRAGFEYLSSNQNMYIYLNVTGQASRKLAGTIVKALMYSTDTGNSSDHLDEWTDPTFDPING